MPGMVRPSWRSISIAAGLTGVFALPLAMAAPVVVPSAADALLGVVPAAPEQPATGVELQVQRGALVLNNAFVQQLYALVQSDRDLTSAARDAYALIFTEHTTDAAKQWASIQASLRGESLVVAQITWVYLLSRLDAPQSFADAWLSLAAQPEMRAHRLMIAMDPVVGPTFEAEVWKRGIALSADQSARAQDQLKGDLSFMGRTIYALSYVRQGARAASIARALPKDHPLKLPLAQTAALAAARAGDLGGAGKILKLDVEPALSALAKPDLWSRHYLQVARLLYQAGVNDAAESYYLKIPDNSLDFLTAREELSWVWLRKGDTLKLRGNLETLSGKTARAFGDVFAPEIPLVRAVSNLKLCLYPSVEADFRDFISRNALWAKRIDSALKASAPPAPPLGDEFMQIAAARVRALEQEIAAVAAWPELQASLQVRLNDARLAQVSEARRQWGNARAILAEAIRKMQFVKVELLSRSQQMAESGAREQVLTSQAAPVRATSLKEREAQLGIRAEEQVYPFDGVIWPDEMFKLRSMAQSRCLQKGGAL